MLRPVEMTPNPYEAPTCQGTKEVRRKIEVFRYWVHAQAVALGVTDLILSSGLQERVSCTKHLSRVTPHG